MDAFKAVLGRAERSLVNELVDVRNKLSHNETFTYDDAERALDSMRRLMEAISAGETAEQLSKMRDTILRTKFTELQRNEERRKTQRLDISVETVAGLLPWREVVEPHQDVATGEFQQAEFAADLGKVHTGSAPAEYRDPQQFFSRTYLTEGLSTLLVGAAKRLSGGGGDPVVETGSPCRTELELHGSFSSCGVMMRSVAQATPRASSQALAKPVGPCSAISRAMRI